MITTMHWSLLDRKGSFAFIDYFSNVLFICSVLFTGARASWELQRSPTAGLRLILGYFLTVTGLVEPARDQCCSSKEGNRTGTESWIPECWGEMQIRWDSWGAFPAAHGRSRHGCHSKCMSSAMASRFCFKRSQKSFWQGEREGKEKKRRRRKRRRERERWAPSTIISAFLFHFIFWSQNHSH